MPKLLYIWKEHTLWDVRYDKFFRTLTGSGWEVYNLVRWREGCEFPEKINSVHIIPVGRDRKAVTSEPVSSNPVWRNAIYDTARELKPDIIMPREIMLAGAAANAGRKLNIPVVMDMAENYPAAMKDWKKYNDNFIRKVMVHYLDMPEHVEKNCVPKMDGIITVCREQCERLNLMYDYPNKRMAVVHNTPELSSLQSIKKGFSGRARVFTHHGNVTGDKRIGKFVTGFIEAAKVRDDIELHIAGAGEYFDDLRKMADNSHCPDRIIMTGKYRFEDVPKIIEAADIGVIPYQVSDFNNTTIHNKVFDFMAAGKPLFLSSTLPFRRLIEETGAGIAVDCESPEAIAAAITDIDNRNLAAMSSNGLRFASEKYNWDIDGAGLVGFLERYL